ncbi:hypothetical protein F5Y05DRAFT_379592 [Hypoxylon sp. FL0543]|nr:hypothetical protein F5Y05DRAFT_379592 [Hypoxylon sp. FL0543]
MDLFNTPKTSVSTYDAVEASSNTLSGTGVMLNGATIDKLMLTFGSDPKIADLAAIFSQLLNGNGNGTTAPDDADKTLAEYVSDPGYTSDPAPKQDLSQHLSAGPTILDGILLQSISEFRDSHFPHLKAFGDSISESIKQYAGPRMGTVLSSLSLPYQQELQEWIASTNSRLLWLDGWVNAASSSWTTDLALEVLGTTATATVHQNSSEAAIVYHFCNAGNGANTTSEIILQDFIFQLVTSPAARNFTQTACHRCQLSKDRLLEASTPGDFEDLWDYFLSCVAVSKVKSLVLILSDLDSLTTGFGKSLRDVLGFRKLVDGLIDLSQRDAVHMKIFVTTKTSAAVDYVSKKDLTPSRQVLVRLPSPPDRMRPTRKDARMFRVPIEGGPLVNTSDIDDWDSEEPTSAAKIAASYMFDAEEDSEVDFPDETEADLGLEQELERGSSDDLERNSGDQDNQDIQVPSRVPENSSQGYSSVEVGIVREDDLDELVSYSDLESDVSSKGPVEKENGKEDIDDEVAAMLWDSDDADD